MRHFDRKSVLVCLCASSSLLGTGAKSPESWIPARWAGGPLELTLRARAKATPTNPAVREAIASWYDLSTLDLLKDSPVNCLLVTWSGGTDRDLERKQQQLVGDYAREAHRRGLSIVGLIAPGSQAAESVSAAVAAGLDGLAAEGDFELGFMEELRRSLAAAKSAIPIIPIERDLARAWQTNGPIRAIEGVSPNARNLADMGIRSAPSSESWIESNIWLVHALAVRPVWISHQPAGGSASDYVKFVADAAVAGGRWIVAFDDGLRAKLRHQDPAALETWRRVSAVLRFAEDHAAWREFPPYGNLAFIADPTDCELAGEYLKLLTRRHVPYRLMQRSELSATSLAGFSAVLAAQLSLPTQPERRILSDFASLGGAVVAGTWWGGAPKDEPYAEIPAGKGRVLVYRQPDPESVARDMKDLLSQQELGVVAFNVPAVMTYASSAGSGPRLLVQLLNYANSPAEAITIRVHGKFTSARLYAPETAASELAVKAAEGSTEISIPKLLSWGGVVLE